MIVGSTSYFEVSTLVLITWLFSEIMIGVSMLCWMRIHPIFLIEFSLTKRLPLVLECNCFLSYWSVFSCFLYFFDSSMIYLDISLISSYYPWYLSIFLLRLLLFLFSLALSLYWVSIIVFYKSYSLIYDYWISATLVWISSRFLENSCIYVCFVVS